MTILIHIGYPKTGTTWLQDSFFEHEPMSRVVARHAEVDEWIIRPHALDFDLAGARAHFQPKLAAPDAEDGFDVISSETLCGNPFFGGRDGAEVAERLKQIFPDARILITIRNQVSALISVYKQYLLRGGTEHHARFFHPDNEPGYHYFDHRYFEYDRLARFYMGLFGPDNVRVMLHEDMAKNSLEFCRRVASFASGRPDPAIRRPDPERRAVSAPDHVLPVLRRINHFRGGRMNPGAFMQLGAPADFAYRAARKLGGALCNPRRSALRDYVVRHFGDAYRESNGRLSQMIERDLSALGYPTTDQGAPSPAAEAGDAHRDGVPVPATMPAASHQQA